MDQQEPHSSNQPNAKRQKLNIERDQSPGANDDADDAAAAVAPIVQQRADILKLDIDCFEEAFDYLQLRELISVGKTCKRLQQVAGYCFQQNYGNDKMQTIPKIISTISAYFIPFIRKIKITSKRELEYFLQTESKFHRIKQIEMNGLDFTQEEIGRLITNAIWSKLEVLCVGGCTFSDNLKEILNLCTKLKRLEIFYCRGEYNWFDRKYPTLEYFKFCSRHYESIKSIPKFLELNPNIRKFATSHGVLWENREKMITANIKLDDLAICFGYEVRSTYRSTGAGNNYPGIIPQHRSMWTLLNELYERGFYTKLQLYFEGSLQQEQINQLASVKGLNKLHLLSCHSISLTILENLEEIYMYISHHVADLELLPNNLINLKRIHFINTRFDTILPFIRRSVEMQRIKVNRLSAGVHFNEDTKVIDLRALNREREELPDAAKITFYVDEEIYLATKWAFGETDFALIRLKRDTSFEWKHDFLG